MIKAIILDVDGVIVGEKIGFNSPNPHPLVISALKEIKEQGITVSLCTAKPHYSVKYIIDNAQLNNPHITDAGALIIDPLNNKIINSYNVSSQHVKEVIDICLSNKIYIEFYTDKDYFIQSDQQSLITTKHTHILQKEPKIVPNLIKESENHLITKIMPIAVDEADKKHIQSILEPFNEKLMISWGVHPVALPLQFAIVTSKETSKQQAAQNIIFNLGIGPNEVLGIGDSTSDWQFMKLCGYVGTLENGSKEIQELVKSKDDNHFCIGKSVDENGILDIFNQFIQY